MIYVGGKKVGMPSANKCFFGVNIAFISFPPTPAAEPVLFSSSKHNLLTINIESNFT